MSAENTTQQRSTAVVGAAPIREKLKAQQERAIARAREAIAKARENHELTEEQARRIAILAFKTSAFARESDEIEVIFEEGSESASVSRRYSVSGEELAAGDAPSPKAASDGKAAEE